MSSPKLGEKSSSKNNEPNESISRFGIRNWKGKLSRKDSMQHSHDSTANTCYFLKLPGELRNHIYSYLIYPQQERITLTTVTIPKYLVSVIIRSPIYRINNQIRAEALSYLCKNKIFAFINFRPTVVFLEGAGPSGRAGLAEMNLMLTYWNPSEQGVRESQRVVELMKEAKNLRQFRLEFAPSFHLEAVTPAQWDVLGMLKTAVGEGGIFTWRIYGAKTYEWEAMPEQVQVYLGRENAVTA